MVMVKHSYFLIYSSQFFLLGIPFDEVASVEIINGKLIIEGIVIRQENEGGFWFIISCPF